ncbi:acetyltransferase (GNAT) family protein [Curtobacterium sp. PhB142]|uniref:GNAT family N-acetyltransferase n=1 Tax=unclassified Curtobacterium TaxID=257496 RepID=UPI0010ECC0D4|nr:MULTISPECIES: GNAT family N-acetyltransferase [unclassified Curtobacterium]TCL80521.1 acetyltransferase (GNAT) family protein [Curtobacterium sp. PhB142]TCL99761.1 acetyltransferase (GNAT) family protein [Curtobacterium sp. PhB134]
MLSYTASLLAGAFRNGLVDVVEDAAGHVIGVAVWEAPGATTSLFRRLRYLPTYVRAIGLRNLPATTRASRVYSENRPQTPHWYLADIAVDPRSAGQGIGSNLLQHRLGSIDEEHAAAYLEATTPGSRRLYKRFGFTDQASMGLLASGYPYAMHRPATQQTTGTVVR